MYVRDDVNIKVLQMPTFTTDLPVITDTGKQISIYIQVTVRNMTENIGLKRFRTADTHRNTHIRVTIRHMTEFTGL